MCGNATLATVLSTPRPIVANLIEAVIVPRLQPGARALAPHLPSRINVTTVLY
jgi:hypothetical protein